MGAALADSPAAGLGRWVATNARWLRMAVAVSGLVVLLWGPQQVLADGSGRGHIGPSRSVSTAGWNQQSPEGRSQSDSPGEELAF